jgi:hypothetical protein
MEDRINVLKEIFGILIISTLILSSAAVIGENANKQTQIEICLSELAQPNNNIINQESNTSGKVILWDNGLPDNRSAISCIFNPSYPSGPLDRLVIDDFIVPEPGWIVNDGHFNIGIGDTLVEHITGVNVYFFGSTGPCEPDTKPIAFRTASYTATFTGDYHIYPHIAVDCQFAPVSLSPGEYWVCFQPVMKEYNFSYWFTAANIGCSIFIDFPDVGYPRWTWGFDVFGHEWDVSWYLTYEEPVPAICCDSLNMTWNKIPAGSFIGDGQFYVCNCGDPYSTLNWTIKDWPTWGENWTFNPPNGAEPYSGSGTYVSFTFTAPSKKNKKFVGKIKVINSDDPTDFCEMDIQVKTPRNRGEFFNFFENLINHFPMLRFVLV